MSWSSAQADAQLMVDRLQLKNEDIVGRLLDLDAMFPECPFQGRYRIMVFQAVARILKKRGANTNIADIVKG